jgi:alkaline phosphatase
MLDNMARAAINSLSSSSPGGFFLMIEGASIDKQAHAQDAERAIWDTIEFDRAVGVAKRFAEETNSDSDPNNDTLVVVTADHETSGFFADRRA